MRKSKFSESQIVAILKSARGTELAAEHVFSIYKKGKAFKARLNASASVELLELMFCFRK